MFIDYYELLEIQENASFEEIKIAFKKQALKWHPDKNIGFDTTKRMQELNEAYLILKDKEARERYNIEYQLFKEYKRKSQIIKQEEKKAEKRKQDEQKEHSKENHTKYEYQNYSVKDDILNNWMNSAKRQAVSLAKQTIEDLKGMVSVGVKSAKNEFMGSIFTYLIIGIIFSIISVCIKSCH